jgi:hypothetical protein
VIQRIGHPQKQTHSNGTLEDNFNTFVF